MFDISTKWTFIEELVYHNWNIPLYLHINLLNKYGVVLTKQLRLFSKLTNIHYDNKLDPAIRNCK